MVVTTKETVGGRREAKAPVLTGAQMVWEALVREGVEVVFGYPGGQVIPLYHALPGFPLHHVLVRHEQAAAHAADGYARATGRVGVCVATSGPGATNLVTGIATAHSDSSPLVAITGQVPTALLGRNAFQEVDTCSITRAVTKANYLVTDVRDVAPILREAFRVAQNGRPGPVLVDVPKDVQTSHAPFFYEPAGETNPYRGSNAAGGVQARRAAELLRRAERPLILAGRGVQLAGACEELRLLAERTGTPVATTLMGLGSFPGSHQLSLGLAGMHGRVEANRAVCECDLLLAVGTRLNDRLTAKVASFAPRARIVHVDVDPAELGKNVRVDVPICGDLRAVLAALLGEELGADSRPAWWKQLEAWRGKAGRAPRGDDELVDPKGVMAALYQHTAGEAVIVTDVGQHQLWAAQGYTYDRPATYVSSGGLGTMGFGLPAALGAKMGRPEAPVWAVVGDGGIQMNIQELATLVQEGAAVKIALMNNGYLGMVRQWQELFFERNYSASAITGPDFVRVAEAYGVPARRVARAGEVPAALAWASATEGPVLLEFVVEPEQNVYPMVPPGKALADSMEG